MFRLIPLLLPGCVVLEIHEGNGVPATALREVGTFDAVESTSVVDVEVVPGEPGAVEVTCDENLVDHIETLVVDGTLFVQILQDKPHPKELFPNTRCVATVSATALRSLASSGAGDILVEEGVFFQTVATSGSGDVLGLGQVQAERLDVLTSGSGEITLAGMSGGDLNVTSSGSGEVTIVAGGVTRVTLVSSGSGDVWVRGVTAETVDVVLSGSGDGEVTATELVEGVLSGSGDLVVWGDPGQIDVVTSGSGEVQPGE